MKVFTMLMSVSILTLAGCGGKADSESASAPPSAASQLKSDMTSGWQSTPLPVNTQPTPVKQGAAPLVYRVEGGATIRVHDVSSKLDLATGYVSGGSIVRVDARRGVIYGDQVVFAGPLKEDGRYVIFVEPTGENVARQGVFQPRPREAR